MNTLREKWIACSFEFDGKWEQDHLPQISQMRNHSTTPAAKSPSWRKGWRQISWPYHPGLHLLPPTWVLESDVKSSQQVADIHSNDTTLRKAGD